MVQDDGAADPLHYPQVSMHLDLGIEIKIVGPLLLNLQVGSVQVLLRVKLYPRKPFIIQRSYGTGNGNLEVAWQFLEDRLYVIVPEVGLDILDEQDKSLGLVSEVGGVSDVELAVQVEFGDPVLFEKSAPYPHIELGRLVFQVHLLIALELLVKLSLLQNVKLPHSFQIFLFIKGIVFFFKPL